MVQEKKSFMLYRDYREHLELLTDEERGRLLMALFDYNETGSPPALEGATRMAFSFIKAQMDRDAAKYAKKCAKNRENGARGGRPPKPTETEENERNPAEPTETEENPPKPKETERFFEEPKKPEKEKDKDKDEDEEKEKEKEKEKDINIFSFSSSDEEGDIPEEQPKPSLIETRFGEFWDIYPKKVAKKDALKAWNKIKPTAELHARIIKAVTTQKKSAKWLDENGRFIPNPATWLNGGRWDDEVKEVKNNENAQRPIQNWGRGFEPAG